MAHAKALAPAIIALALLGCSMGNIEEPVRQMGEIIAVGPVVYNVLETDWRRQLGGGLESSVPANRFMLIRLTITNSGNQQVAVPLLTLEDDEGNVYRELSDVKGVANWLGLLRILDPASSIQGALVFDVPPQNYRLRVTDCGDLEDEKTALVEIPLTISTPGANASASDPTAGL